MTYLRAWWRLLTERVNPAGSHRRWINGRSVEVRPWREGREDLL